MESNRRDDGKKKLERIPFMRRQVIFGAATLLALAVLLIVGLYPRDAKAPPATDTASPQADLAGTVSSTKLESGCELIQNMTYSRCGHEVTRRTGMPQELVGKTRQDIETAYDQWRVTEFLPKRVTMERQLDLYCAQHVVLMPDETGILGVFENKYGDAMAFLQTLETSLDSLPEAIQEEIRVGKGFDTLAELEQWLESVES